MLKEFKEKLQTKNFDGWIGIHVDPTKGNYNQSFAYCVFRKSPMNDECIKSIQCPRGKSDPFSIALFIQSMGILSSKLEIWNNGYFSLESAKADCQKALKVRQSFFDSQLNQQAINC